MKKRVLAIVMAGVMSLGMLAGCGKESGNAAEVNNGAGAETEAEVPEDAPKGEGAENPGEVGMINPWKECTEEEANGMVSRLFKAPDGSKVLDWMYCEDEAVVNDGLSPLVQLEFEIDGMIFNARAQVTGDKMVDVSGLYYDWKNEEEITLANWGGGNMKGTIKQSENESGIIEMVSWYDVEIGISYTLSVAAEDLDGFDLQAVAEQMYNADNEPFTGMELKDDPEAAAAEVEKALLAKIAEDYGADVTDQKVYVDKIYDTAAEQDFEPVAAMGLTADQVAFEAHFELKPAEGVDVNSLMIPNGVFDEESGWVKDVQRLGVLTPDGNGGYTVESYGTGW